MNFLPPLDFEVEDEYSSKPVESTHGASYSEDHDKPRHHGSVFMHTHRALKLFAMGFIASFIFISIHRRACSSKRRADRRAHREERRRRRSFRRSKRCHAVKRFWARITGRPYNEEHHFDEKSAALLSNAEDGLSVTMTEELAQLRTAAGVVEQMVVAAAHPQPPAVWIHTVADHQFSEGRPLLRHDETEDSDMSSSIADGMQYTPGSTDYDPANSREGSMTDVLGLDSKK